jgi:hypothetical protein
MRLLPDWSRSFPQSFPLALSEYFPLPRVNVAAHHNGGALRFTYRHHVLQSVSPPGVKPENHLEKF